MSAGGGGGGGAAIVRQAPGKALTLVGPFLLFAALPLEQYAMCEAIFAISSIAAILSGWGLSSALPYGVFVRGNNHVLALMLRHFGGAVVTASLATVICAVCVLVGGAEDIWVLRYVALLGLVSCSLLGQAFVAAILKVKAKYAWAALAEHSGWFAVCLGSVAGMAARRNAPLDLVLAFFVLNLTVIGMALRVLAGGVHASPTEIQGASPHAIGLPFMNVQLNSVVCVSAARVIFLITGHMSASAAVSLITRMSAPMTFIYQTLSAALVDRLFSSSEEIRAQAAGALARRLIGASAMIVFALGAFITFGPIMPLSAPSLTACAFFSVQTLMFLSITDGMAIDTAGTRRHIQTVYRLWVAAACLVAGVTLVALADIPSEQMTLLATALAWLLFGAVALMQVLSFRARLDCRTLALVYLAATILSATSIGISLGAQQGLTSIKATLNKSTISSRMAL